MNTPTHYDIIADIHGRFDKLSSLMERLGYSTAGDGFTPPAGHKALFLGDLIDTKPGHPFPGGVRATLRAVKAMCDRGDALCLMGNHELNAIYFHSAGPDGEPLRKHGSKNIAMHQGTLDDFPDHKDPASEWLNVWMPWMKRLPIFLDLGGFRAVHATWHPGMIERLAGRNLECPDFFLACSNKGTPEGEAIEILLKGIEVPLPSPHSFEDHTGAIRKNIRARWWEAVTQDHVCSDLIFPPNEQIGIWPVAAEALPLFQPYDPADPPVFFGHYFKPADSPAHPERHNVACLDHSAATGGPLVAYRWKGEANIKPEHYIQTQSEPDNSDTMHKPTPKTLNEKLNEMDPDERFEFWRKAEQEATDPENKAEIREAWMIDCHSRFIEKMFNDEIDSVDHENHDPYSGDADNEPDHDEEETEDDEYDPNCYAFYSEDSYPVGTLIKAIRGLMDRPDITDETTDNLKVFLFAMQRLPLVTPGVHMSLGLRLDQGGESAWIEIRMGDGEFSLGRGTWIDGDADTETIFEVTPDYREGDAFLASQFAESFKDCARDVCREVVIEDWSDGPFTGWDLAHDKKRWGSLPCSFL